MQSRTKSVFLAFLGSVACVEEEHEPLYDQIMSVEPASPMARGPRKPVGTVSLLSTDVPDFPESTVAAGAYVAVSGPASFAIPLGEPGLLTLHDRVSGQYVRGIEVPYPPYLPPGVAPNALSVAVPGALGDLYVSQVLTGIYRVNTLLGLSEPYSTGPTPDLPPCHLGGPGDCSVSTPCPEPPIPGAPACSADLGLPPLPNSLAFDEGGTLYVSDSFQASIWRVRPDTRSFELWLSDGQLEGNPWSPIPLGANGLAVGPDGYLYVANATGGPMFGGAIYRIPLVDAPSGAQIELVTAFLPFEVPGVPFPLPQGPDGLSFDVDGNLWVTLAFSNTVARLGLDGGVVVSEDRYVHAPPEGIPLNQPSEIHLDALQPRAFFANHALEPATPEHWALFSIETGAPGAPLAKPWVGWDCEVHDCAIDWATFDWAHAATLAYEEIHGL